MTRIRRVLAGIGALVALLVLLVGVPWLLCHFIGWPLPRRVPSLANLGHDLSERGIPDRSLVDALAVVVWIVWALLAISILAETVATVRGARAKRIPMAGLFQPLTGKLVGAVLVAVLALAPRNVPPRPSTAGLAPSSGRPVASAILTDVQLAANRVPVTAPPIVDSTATSRAATDATTATHGSTHPYVVQRGDTLWGIAKRELGDPLRWREIAALNEGRHERTGTFSDPHWIYPGWTLLLPGEGSAAPDRTATSKPAVTPSASPGTATHPAQSATGASRASGSSASSVPATARTARPAGPETSPSSPRGAANGHQQTGEHQAPLPIAPIGAGLLGVAILGLLGGLRLAQQRHRRPGRRIALPTGGLAEVERALAAGADRDTARNIDRAIRLFGCCTREAGVAPTVIAAEVTPGAVRFLLEEEVPATVPFVAEERAWQLDLSDPDVLSALEDASGEPSLLPGLVTIGEDEHGLVLVNLESGGTVAIDGAPVVASELATAIALELAGSSWVERAELYDVGVGTGTANPYRCTTLSSLSEGIALALAHVDRTNRELDRSGRESAALARLVGRDEDWSPLLLVSSDAPTEEEAAAVAGVVDPERSALVLVAPGSFAAGWHLVTHEDGTVEVPVLGRRLHAQRVSRQHLAGIASVLGLAAARVDVAPSEEPYATISVEPEERMLPSEGGDDLRVAVYDVEARSDQEVTEETLWIDDPDVESTETEPIEAVDSLEAAESVAAPANHLHTIEAQRDEHIKVEVDVLGPLQIVGLVRQPSRGKVSELIAWLALHPEGASADRVGTALWPSGRFSEHTLRNYRWDARRSLGADANGVNLLSEYDDLRLSSAVSTDWARFEALSCRQDRDSRHSALDLVRGRAFGELDWTWLTLEGLVAAIEAEVADVALALGAEELEAEEYGGAIHAVEQGLKVVPYDERLHRLAMSAQHGAGNTSGVRLAMDRLTALVEDGVEPVDSVSEETRSLYQSLMARAPRNVIRAIH